MARRPFLAVLGQTPHETRVKYALLSSKRAYLTVNMAIMAILGHFCPKGSLTQGAETEHLRVLYFSLFGPLSGPYVRFPKEFWSKRV